MAEDICETAYSLLEPLKDQLRTITINSKELSLYEYVTQALEIDWYSADYLLTNKDI